MTTSLVSHPPLQATLSEPALHSRPPHLVRDMPQIRIVNTFPGVICGHAYGGAPQAASWPLVTSGLLSAELRAASDMTVLNAAAALQAHQKLQQLHLVR